MTVAEGGVGVGAGREQGGLVERERLGLRWTPNKCLDPKIYSKTWELVLRRKE